MSPEQIKDPRSVDPRSDLWSAAVMTWEMLTGRVAFPAPTEYARLAAVMTFVPDALDKVEPSLAPIAPVIARAMQKDMTQRFASALEMARALPSATPETTRTNVTPLSRLPMVPSVFAPISGISPGASSERHTPAAPEMTSTPPEAKSPGGTLQSAAPAVLHSPLPAPHVIVVEPRDRTMPSKDLPVLDPPDERGVLFRGVPAWIVIVLVTLALGVGLVLGIAVARSA
jgi:serine/threonine-protein kinase